MARKYDLNNRMSVGRGMIYVVLTLLGIVMLYPMWYVLCVSLSNNTALAGKGLILWPVDFNLNAYRYVLNTPDLLNIYGNTLYVMFFGLVLSMVLTICAAYGLARKPRGYKFATYFFLIPMLFSGCAAAKNPALRSAICRAFRCDASETDNDAMRGLAAIAAMLDA